MDLILASSGGREERVLFDDFDFEVGTGNTFQITMNYATFKNDIVKGKRIYIPDTEYGGIIKGIESATNTNQIYVKGYTWRGYLMRHIIVPPSGSDYYIASGELNDIIRALVTVPGFNVSTASTGVSVNYQFARYVDVDTGLKAMLRTVGYRLDIKYIQTQNGGNVLVQAVPAGSYGDKVEYSQDSMIDFASSDDEMGVNHLICLGIGELKNRTVLHLYTDRNGAISQTQSIFGLDEFTEVYDNPGAEADTLLESGKERLRTVRSSNTFTAEIKNNIEQELYIGDIISGRDYITGNAVTKPIASKIVKRENGIISHEYKIEGQT